MMHCDHFIDCCGSVRVQETRDPILFVLGHLRAMLYGEPLPEVVAPLTGRRAQKQGSHFKSFRLPERDHSNQNTPRLVNEALPQRQRTEGAVKPDHGHGNHGDLTALESLRKLQMQTVSSGALSDPAQSTHNTPRTHPNHNVHSATAPSRPHSPPLQHSLFDPQPLSAAVLHHSTQPAGAASTSSVSRTLTHVPAIPLTHPHTTPLLESVTLNAPLLAGPSPAFSTQTRSLVTEATAGSPFASPTLGPSRALLLPSLDRSDGMPDLQNASASELLAVLRAVLREAQVI